MKIFKKFSFWLPVIYLLITVIPFILGGVDRGIIFYMTDIFDLLPNNIKNNFSILAVNAMGWFFIGLLIDKIIHKFKKKNA